jgi:transcriptional regulator with XRE-family HTH domain
MTPNEIFGTQMKDARRARGWTQQRMAGRMNAAGFSWVQTTVTKTERASRPVPVEEAAALAAILHLDLNVLIPDLRELRCPVCDDRPPAGFTCNACGATGSEGKP